MSAIKRLYEITNDHLPVTSYQSPVTVYQIRAWQGHKIEEKYFFVNQGSFLIAAVKIDNWQNPSPNLKPETFVLNTKKPQILYIPAGYANGIKPLENNSQLTVYSTVSLEESINDDYRYDKNLWMDWNDK
jgi:dTDP-4-dehydrorhamnose 3,5-epimerase